MSLLTADRDIEAAGVLVLSSPHLYENVGFHCQQAVEKYLKAVLVASALPAPFIHNLIVLMTPLQQAGIVQFGSQDLANAATLNELPLNYATSWTMLPATPPPTCWTWRSNSK